MVGTFIRKTAFLVSVFLFCFSAVTTSSQASEVPQAPISTAIPGNFVPTGTVNEIYPDKAYVEYGTEGGPERKPVPFSASQCNQGGCHYPTNRWFTDLMFLATTHNNVGENFAVAQSPYDLSVFDDSTILVNTIGQPYDMVPGLYVRFNIPNMVISKAEKPYAFNLNGDMYYPYLMTNPTSHFVFTVPYKLGEKPETTREITYYDPLTFTTKWTLNSSGGSMTAPIVRGAPYITMEYQNLPITLRTYQNSGFFAISADNKTPEMLQEGKKYTGSTFRFMITVQDFSQGSKQPKDPFPQRYVEYILFASSPITLEFLQRPVADPAFVLQSVNADTGAPQNFTGVIRVAYVGAETVNSTDNAEAQKLGFEAFTSNKFASTEKMLTDYATVYPVGVNLKLNSDENKGQVIFAWKTKRMDGTPSNPTDPVLMLAFEKNQRPYLENITPGDPSYRLMTLRGTMVPVISNAWTLNVPYSNELKEANLWFGSKAIPEALKPELQTALTSDIAWLQKPFAYPRPAIYIAARNDSYAFGKQVARIARLALIADQLGDTASRDIALAKIKEAISLWFPKAVPEKDPNGSKQSYMRYDDKFGGIVTARAASSPENCDYDGNTQKDQCGYNLDFYNGQYTDHHFHYGYFLYAAAVLAKYDAAWLSQYKESINLLARDLANPSEEDPYFTQYRYFDLFEGHAFANGLVPGGDGRNQESTSEGVNAWYGLTLWASVTGNTSLENIARILTMREARAAQDWTQITPGDSIYDNFIADPNTFDNPQNVAIRMGEQIVSGINWSLKVDHTTFFGLVKSYLIGIQLMPFTPISQALISSSWIAAKNSAGKHAILDAVDNLVTRIKYFQDVSSDQSIFNKFSIEWNDFKSRHPQTSAKDYWVQFAGKLNGSYQWGLNAIPAFALVDPDLTYRYTAFNTNGIFFTEMQKVNDAFYQAALSKNNLITVKGLSDDRTCPPTSDKPVIDNCYQLPSGVVGDFGWPIAQVNYDGIDKGETITSLLWWDFVNKGPDAKANPPALFWLYDDPKVNDLSGTSALLSWEKAKIINGEGTLKYTVQIKGKMVCDTEDTVCQLTDLLPNTNYVASITASEKEDKVKSITTGNPAYITTYVPFVTLTDNMTSFLRFDGTISKEKLSDTSVKLSWPSALLCDAKDPSSCQEGTNVGYQVNSSAEKILCTLSPETNCTLTDLDPNASYTIAVLAIDNTNHAQQKRLYLTFKVNDEPVTPIINWSKIITVKTNDAKASAEVNWDAATGSDNLWYVVYLDENKISEAAIPQTLLLEKLSYATHQIRIVVSDKDNAKVIPMTSTKNFILNQPATNELNWTGNRAVSGTGNTAQATLTWSAASTGNSVNDNRIAYTVYFTINGNEKVACNTIGQTTCTLAGPHSAGNYGLRVTASYPDFTSPVPLTGTMNLSPSTPNLVWTNTQLSGTGTASGIDITWSAATTGNLDNDKNIKYNVALSLNGYGFIVCSVSGRTSCTVPGSPSKGNYTLGVTASYPNLPSPTPLSGSMIIK